MTQYIAFLRGVNVAGKWVKMEDVRKRMSSAGYENVETFIQSGNISFETTKNDTISLQKRISKEMGLLAGSPVESMVFTRSELQVILAANPFSKIKTKSEDKKTIIFLKEEPAKIILPMFSTQKDVEIFYCKNRIACAISRKYNNKYQFPTALVENNWHTPATTRFWHTFEQMMDAFK